MQSITNFTWSGLACLDIMLQSRHNTCQNMTPYTCQNNDVGQSNLRNVKAMSEIYVFLQHGMGRLVRKGGGDLPNQTSPR